MKKLIIAETHPVQYHAPVYRCAAREFGVSLMVLYGSDFSVAGYRDKEFGASFAWDTDLLKGMENHFLSNVAEGGVRDYDSVNATGVDQAMQKLAPDAVMALGYAHPFDRAVLDWARKHRKPLLFRGETLDHAQQRSRWKSWLRDAVLRRLYMRCSALLFVGQRSRAHYERLGVPAEKLFSSPYCVDASSFRCSEEDRAALRGPTRERLWIGDKAVVILFSGKLSERKGVDLIPQAVRKLPTGLRAHVHVLFLGDGALRESLAQACALEPVVQATFAGFQNQSSLSAYYHAADLLVLPSRAGETWGLVVNEALMHGLPCVVSDKVGCQPDLVLPGRTGAVCKSGDAVSLAEALAKVMGQLQAKNMAADCKAVVAGYSVRAAAEGIAQAMNSVCRG